MFSVFEQIILMGILMACIACVGALTFFLNEVNLKKQLHFFTALAAGSLLGGAFFHLLPVALDEYHQASIVFSYFLAGFTLLLLGEQILLWISKHKLKKTKRPLGYLILFANGLHNFIGGVGIGAAFMHDTQMGLSAWIAAAFHELPQELGDFGILVNSGWQRKKALLANFLSALTFPIGGITVYKLSVFFDTKLLMSFAAGNFVYIASSGLIPEIKQHTGLAHAFLNLIIFCLGILLMYLLV
jgi:zinc and cadmium transporter